MFLNFSCKIHHIGQVDSILVLGPGRPDWISEHSLIGNCRRSWNASMKTGVWTGESFVNRSNILRRLDNESNVKVVILVLGQLGIWLSVGHGDAEYWVTMIGITTHEPGMLLVEHHTETIRVDEQMLDDTAKLGLIKICWGETLAAANMFGCVHRPVLHFLLVGL